MPDEARESHLSGRDQSIETLFRNAIKENNQEEIEKWNKLRKTPFNRTKLSN
jgi:hypothetical protein